MLETIRLLEFREPWFLCAAILSPLAYWLAARVPGAVTFSSLSLPGAGPRTIRLRLRFVPSLLVALAVVFLAIAMAGPRTGDAVTRVKREGIAIMMVVDRSGSMDARDFVSGDYSVSRLDAVKSVLKHFVGGGGIGPGRPDDLIGLIAFGTFADPMAPLTLDHPNLLAILDELTVARDEGETATAIGEGLALAVERLREHPAKSKVVTLLTDGVNNAGNVGPLQAAELAAANNIKVYTIGAGSNGIAPMPVRTGGGRTVLQPRRVEIDERTLESIAKRTGGKYFNSRDADGLKETYREIDRLERSAITELRFLQYQEHYPVFLLIAVGMVAGASLLSRTTFRRLP